MRYFAGLLGTILIFFLVACENKPATSTAAPLPSSIPVTALTPIELVVISDLEARYGLKLYPGRSGCIQALDDGLLTYCLALTGMTRVGNAEWEQLLPDTRFYMVDISAWRGGGALLPHETEDAGTTPYLAAWRNGQVYYLESFDRLLEANAIAVRDINRELVARSFALMSIPKYLGGEVRFQDWKPVEPGAYRHPYTHVLKAWTQIWGCEVFWWFVFDADRMLTVTISGGDCFGNEAADYIKDGKYFQFGDEGIPIGVPPYFNDYFFNR